MGFEDYFKRQVDQLGRVLGQMLTGLLGLKSEGKFSEGEELVRQTVTVKTGIDFNELISFTSESLPSVLKDRFNWTNANIGTLADIFYELADGMEENNKEASRSYFKKALVIYEHLHRIDTTYSIERKIKIDEIKSILTNI